MFRLVVALFLASVVSAQTAASTNQAGPDLPTPTPAQIADLVTQLDQMKAMVQAGHFKDAFGVNMRFSNQLGKLSVRVLTPEAQVLHYEQLMAQQPRARSAYLATAARFALDAGQLDKAESWARELLQVAVTEKPGILTGQQVHAAHVLLGRVALQRTHDVPLATSELLAAAKVTPSSTMQKFGPNMSLARDLLASGERATVLEYLNSFHELSPEATAKLSDWAKLIQAGAIPDFGASTLFHL